MIKRQMTWAELLLILVLVPASVWVVSSSAEYLNDRITIEVEFKK